MDKPLLGIVFYETRMHLRRQMIPVLLLCLLFLIMIAIIQPLRQIFATLPSQFSGPSLSEAEKLQTTLYAMRMVWTMTMLWFMATLPLIVAETIPVDRHYGVRELLDTLPVGRATYLGAKVLGVWVTLLGGMLLVAVIVALLVRLLIAPFFLEGYVRAWLAVLPLTLFIATASVVVPMGQPNRRRAVAVALGIVIYLVYGVIEVSLNRGLSWWFPTQPGTFITLTVDYYTGVASQEFMHLLPPRDESLASPALSRVAVQTLAQVGLVWLAGWAWLRWNEGRRLS